MREGLDLKQLTGETTIQKNQTRIKNFKVVLSPQRLMGIRLERCIGIIASLDRLLTTIGKHR